MTTYIAATAQQTFPKHDAKNDPNIWYYHEHRLVAEEHQIEKLQYWHEPYLIGRE